MKMRGERLAEMSEEELVEMREREEELAEMREEELAKRRERRAYFAAIAERYASIDAFIHENGHWLDMVGIELTADGDHLTLYIQLDFTDYEQYYIVCGRNGRLTASKIVGFHGWDCAFHWMNTDTGEYAEENDITEEIA